MGGILLNQEGKRFVNELTTRDTVARAILSQPGAQALLLLGQDSAQRFGMPAIDFYCARGLMTKAATVEEAAAGIGITAAALTMELEAYNAAARTGNDALGKHVFPATVDTTGPLFLARVVPVIHYTMGGARIDTDGRVLKADGSPVPGLFGAGEVTGGVHGANRLAGNSLLECCVFGLRAGKAAAATAAALKAA